MAIVVVIQRRFELSIVELFSWFANENNNRALSSVGTIFQIFGLIIPALIGIVVFVRRSNRRARDDVLEFLRDWNSPDKNAVRYASLDVFKKFKEGKMSFRDIFNDAEKRIQTTSFLNEQELLAMFVMSEGKNSYRANIYKTHFRSSILGYWDLVHPFVMELRDQRQNQNIFIELERLVAEWK